MSQAYRFYKARKKAALRAMEDHVRFSGVFSMLRDGMHEALPQIVARTQVSANTVAAVDR